MTEFQRGLLISLSIGGSRRRAHHTTRLRRAYGENGHSTSIQEYPCSSKRLEASRPGMAVSSVCGQGPTIWTSLCTGDILGSGWRPRVDNEPQRSHVGNPLCRWFPNNWWTFLRWISTKHDLNEQNMHACRSPNGAIQDPRSNMQNYLLGHRAGLHSHGNLSPRRQANQCTQNPGSMKKSKILH